MSFSPRLSLLAALAEFFASLEGAHMYKAKPSGGGIQVDAEMSNKLREPFEPEKISKLPRIICPACRDAEDKVCTRHEKSECGVCGTYVTERHMHLDYVGHADVTARLLESDPEWTWDPVAVDEFNQPIITEALDGSWKLWITLTVGGVTRRGVGTVERGKYTKEVEKQLIGDALRNAAMRFGVAIDLWSKAERAGGANENASRGARVGTPVTVEVLDGVTIESVVTVPGTVTVESATSAQRRAADPVVFEDEPLPEYHGGDEDEAADWVEPKAGPAGEVATEVVAPTQATQAQPVPARVNPVVARTEGLIGGGPSEGQKNAISGLFDTLEIAMANRAGYVSSIVGREVLGVEELSKTEAALVLRGLVRESEARAKAAFPDGEASGF